MKNALTVFNFSDTLTFFSIGYECHHEGIATLAGILLATDAINRSTPSREELEGALNKLLASGYIAMSNKDYLLTPRGKAIYYGTTRTPEMTVFDQIHEVQRKLSKKSPLAESLNAIIITERQFRNAIKGAHNLFKQL